MKMKKSQFREDAATYIQMIHLLNEYNPGWKIILIGVLLEGIFPFIAIFLSSMLLDALYAGRSMQEMALLVLAGTGASFVTAILRHLVTKKKNIMEICGTKVMKKNTDKKIPKCYNEVQ